MWGLNMYGIETSILLWQSTALHSTKLNYQSSSFLFLFLFLFCVPFHFFTPLTLSWSFSSQAITSIIHIALTAVFTTHVPWLHCSTELYFDLSLKINSAPNLSSHLLLDSLAPLPISLFLTLLSFWLFVASQAEKLSPGHKYIGSFPCDRDVGNVKKKEESRAHP